MLMSALVWLLHLTQLSHLTYIDGQITYCSSKLQEEWKENRTPSNFNFQPDFVDIGFIPSTSYRQKTEVHWPFLSGTQSCLCAVVLKWGHILRYEGGKTVLSVCFELLKRATWLQLTIISYCRCIYLCATKMKTLRVHLTWGPQGWWPTIRLFCQATSTETDVRIDPKHIRSWHDMTGRERGANTRSVRRTSSTVTRLVRVGSQHLRHQEKTKT